MRFVFMFVNKANLCNPILFIINFSLVDSAKNLYIEFFLSKKVKYKSINKDIFVCVGMSVHLYLPNNAINNAYKF